MSYTCVQLVEVMESFKPVVCKFKKKNLYVNKIPCTFDY